MSVLPVPQGWAHAKLGRVAAVQLGKMLDRARAEGVERQYLRNINVRWDRIDLSDLSTTKFKPSEDAKFDLRPGDVLVCEGGEPGRAAVWTQAGSVVRYQKALHRVRLAAAILPRWLVMALWRDAVSGRLTGRFTGTTIKHLPQEVIVDLDLLVPPTGEQHRIVAALDSYFSRLDAAQAALQRVEANLKRYRASVLKAAVEGRLVPTEAELARKEGREYEPASVLLERILVERRRKWEEAELAKMVAKGKPPANDKWKAKYKEPTTPDTDGLPELPEGWCWASVDQLMGVVRGASPRPKGDPRYFGGNIPWISIGDVTSQPGRYLRYTREGVTEAGAARSRLLPRGTLILSNSGTVCVPKFIAVDGCIHDGFLAFEHIPNGLSLEYMYEWFNAIRPSVRDANRQGMTQVNLNTTIVRQLVVPLPPAAEQPRIAEEVDRVVGVGDRHTVDVRRARSALARLRQSILKWAFEGRLVDQDPSDAPASVLLERIRAERDAAAAAKPKAKRATRKRKAKS